LRVQDLTLLTAREDPENAHAQPTNFTPNSLVACVSFAEAEAR